ncbi:hypothetical protein ERJ75_001300100 [Trypanosoma vivax]|nr:hypothetical protein ERJ75_001300100 [Trypanosoma vivax]
MRSEAQSQYEGSGPLGSAGGGDVDGERTRKHPRAGRYAEEEEGGDYACGRTWERWCELVRHTDAHHKNATTVARKMKDGTAAATPLPKRWLRCPCYPAKRVLEKCLAMHLQAEHGQARREAEDNLLMVECEEFAAHLLGCPNLRELRKRHRLQTLKNEELFFSAQLARLLKELFELARPSAHKTDEPALRPARSIKRHRLVIMADTAYCFSSAAKLIWMCVARVVRKRAREADSSPKALCINAFVSETRVGFGLCSTSPGGFQNQDSYRDSGAQSAKYKENRIFSLIPFLFY